jgi:lipopolysaccharide transport system ATP-binding protein
MQEPIIEIKNVGKKYKITHERGKYVALRDVLTGALKSPFSFLKTKIKRATGLEVQEDFWALRDLNLTINKGDVVGIVGKNGAGKSTLLKILSQITPPTTGEIRIKGKVGSLLEVGTGFHPELTGRENIFLNGAILGMKRTEIARKFDEIVAFAEVEQFLDTPVKYYSSGMYVRLAFSVAAHMEPDILIVDEVLAVGDADFQKKCLGKMRDITQKDGRTILFVSHNINAIQQLCSKCVLLEKGKVVMFDETEKVLDQYSNKNKAQNAINEFSGNPTKSVQISKVTLHNDQGEPSTSIAMDQGLSIDVTFTVKEKVEGIFLSLYFYRQGEIVLVSSYSDLTEALSDFEPGTYSMKVTVPKFLFNIGNYYFDVVIAKPFVEVISEVKNIYFEVQDIRNPKTAVYGVQNQYVGVMGAILDFNIKKKEE